MSRRRATQASGASGRGASRRRGSPTGSNGTDDRAIADRRLALNTSEVARRLGVSLGTVRRWADQGHLPSYRTPGGQRRFSAEDVEAFIVSLGRPGGRGRG